MHKNPDLSETQQANLDFFYANKDKWLQDIAYRNKHVVIAEQKAQGVFDEFATALDFATSYFVYGEFLIQEVYNEEDRIPSTHHFLPRTVGAHSFGGPSTVETHSFGGPIQI